MNEVTPTEDPSLVNECKIELERAKDIHDQTLERKGPFSEGHRTYPIPFNSKLRKKKKYKKQKKNKLEKHQTVPLGISMQNCETFSWELTLKFDENFFY